MNTIERFRKYRNITRKYQPGGQFYDSRGQYGSENNRDYFNFSGKMYKTSYEILRKRGYDHETSDRLAKFITAHKAFESGYGSHIYNNLRFNYGGFGGPNSSINFNSMEHYIESYLNEAQKRYPDIFNATNLEEYSKALFTDEYGYAPRDSNGVSFDSKSHGRYDRKKSQEIYYNGITGSSGVASSPGLKNMEKRSNNNINSWILMNNYEHNPSSDFLDTSLYNQSYSYPRPPLKREVMDLNR